MDKEKREKLRERFLRDLLPRSLGGLAATLGRISSSARKSTDPNVASNLLDEAKHFIEWTAADTEPETAAELVHMQTMITFCSTHGTKPVKATSSEYCFLFRQRLG